MDLRLLAALVAGVTTIVVLVLRIRLDTSAALLIAALVTGSVAESTASDTVASNAAGLGATLGSIGIVIGLGAAVGTIHEASGGADSLAQASPRPFGKAARNGRRSRPARWCPSPLCDSGYRTMNPLVCSLVRVERGGYVTIASAQGCSTTLTHRLVPPTPGSLAASAILGGPILTGLVFTVPLRRSWPTPAGSR